LATLSLALAKEGSSYVSLENRSMVLGAMALALYSSRWYEYLLRFALGGLTSVIGGLAAFAIAGSGCWPAPMVSYRSCSLSWLGTAVITDCRFEDRTFECSTHGRPAAYRFQFHLLISGAPRTFGGLFYNSLLSRGWVSK
jgi:hypothetical protein